MTLSREARRPGCRHCGSREHHTSTHFGRLVKSEIVEVSTRRDPLGLARSSWMVGERRERKEQGA